MHLGDGIVTSPALLVGLNGLGVASAALMQRFRAPTLRSAAWTGTLGAFVLAAQNVNLPVVPGASAHVIGAGLCTLLLGPARAVLALGAVLLVQALFLADGGVTVLGFNVLTIAVLPVLSVHLAHRLFGERRLGLAAALGTLGGNVASALVLATVLVVGAGAAPSLAFGWLVGVQAIAGLVEGLLTAAAVRQLARRAPSLVAARRELERAIPEPLDGPTPRLVERRRALAWAAVLLSLALVAIPLATSTPDALARVVAHGARSK